MNEPIDRSPRKRGGRGKQVRIAIGFLVVIVAVVALIAQAKRSSMVYYVTVSELLQKQGAQRGLRVTGKVVPGTIQRQDQELHFAMTDGKNALPVTYRGVVPDTFSEDGEVVVEGHYSQGAPFEASFLMAKCPSKYQAAPEAKKHPESIPKTS